MRNLVPLLALMVPAVTFAQAPEKVAPDVLATPRNETFPAIDPKTGDLWFSVYDGDAFDKQTIMRAPKDGSSFGQPVVAPFSGTHGDRAPRFAPDGQRLYFTSNRPSPGHPAGDLDIWYVERSGDGWTAPRLADTVSSPSRDMHNSPVNGGGQFVASYRPGGLGRADIWHVAVDGKARNLGAPINTAGGQTDLWVSPDGTWMVLVVTNPPGGLGGDDLMVSGFKGTEWTAPRLLPAPINSNEYEYGPWVAGDWLYFTSHRGGNADIWRVKVSAIH